jgi:tRNA 5-methylaminomethyl-2-thiouridine biosynthesis bifunctional protein
MAESTTATLLSACRLPPAWRDKNIWRILDINFCQGRHFLETWLAWKNDPLRPRLLHYVALTAELASTAELLSSATDSTELTPLAEKLAAQWSGFSSGFHRLTLSAGELMLTLCVGDVTANLRQQQFQADSVFFDGAVSHSIWTVKALARCCRRGTVLGGAADNSSVRAELRQCGFDPQPVSNPIGISVLSAEFKPPWATKNNRQPSPGLSLPIGRCAIIGAGLAGASVAAALARRQWQVVVLDQGAAPAAGASGLPAGLVVPHVSADDCPLSRLSRAGVRLMRWHAQHLLQAGQDWDATGTLERRPEARHGLDAIWHAQAAWLKPAQMVKAWLAQDGVSFQGRAKVANIHRNGDQWHLQNASGQLLAVADRVIFANACGALPLLKRIARADPGIGLRLDHLPTVQAMLGQLSWGCHPDSPNAAFPPYPVNGAGSVIPLVPMEGASAWFAGSTYQLDGTPTASVQENHAVNLGRLQKLWPGLEQVLAQQFADQRINAWTNVRCVTTDHLPMVGPLYAAASPGLWICAGMGSRGLSLASLCAEVLAAQWGGEPLPIEARLARSLRALRHSDAGSCAQAT